jgi:hypothetical protein
MINYSLLDDAFPNDKTKKKSKTGEGYSNRNNECKPLQPSPYTQPSCSDNTTSFQKAIETSMMMSNKDGSGLDGFKKDGVKAYDYDEFDAYLNVTDIKTNNIDTSPEYRNTLFLMDYLKSLRENFNRPIHQSTDKILNIEQFTNNNLQVDINLYNLFLFIFLGIVIIALVHQINQLVISQNSK